MADNDIAALERVLGRLVLTEEDQLEKVLLKLLPLVIDQLKLPSPEARNKVMEILTHVNKRIRDQKSIKLPLPELLDLYMKPDAAAMARNFALVYVEMAFDRAEPNLRAEAVGKMLLDISKRTPQHRDMLLRMAMKGLQGHTSPSGYSQEKEVHARLEKYGFTQSRIDLLVFLEFALKMLLYIPAAYIPKPVAKPDPLAALGIVSAPGQGAPAPADAEPAEPGLPAGLSKADVTWVEAKGVPSVDDLSKMKLGILNFLCTIDAPPKDTLRHLVVAACDFRDEVSRRGEELLRKRCGIDAHKPSVDLEDAKLVASLFKLFSGNKGASVRSEEATYIASPAVRLRLVAIFCKSIKAANAFPGTLEVIFSSVVGENTTQRLKSTGMEFAVWVFKHASDEQLSPMAPVILKALLSQLDEVQGQQDNASSMLRGFTYQAIGQLALRSNTVFKSDISIAQRLFTALSLEPPGTRATLQESVSTLAVAYKGSTGETEAAINELLLESIKSTAEPTRLCAVQWANKLYSFNHVPARYICLLAAGDHKLEVKEEGKRGLKAPKQPKTAVGAPTPEVPATDRIPSPEAMLAYLLEQHPALGKDIDQGKPLVLRAPVFRAVVGFLRLSWEEQAQEGAPAPSEKVQKGYLRLLEAALVKDGTSELHEAALEALLETAYKNQEFHSKWLAAHVPWLRGFLSHTAASARQSASKLLGVAAMGMTSAAQTAQLVKDLLEALDDSDSDKKIKYEDRDGAVTALGFVLAQVGYSPSSGGEGVAFEVSTAGCTTLFKGLFNKDLSLASSAAMALGHAGLRGPLALPLAAEDGTAEAVKGEPPASASQKGAVDRLVELMKERDIKVVMRAARAAGHLCAGSEEAPVLEVLVEALLGLSANKTEEVQFAVGDALAFAFGGVSVTADEVLRSSFESLAVSSKFFISSDTEMIDANAAPSAPAQTPAREAAQTTIITKIMEEYIYHSRSEVRCAACIWLLSLVSFTQKHPKLMGMLTDIQEAFSTLLGDSNELTQDMASRGMSIVYAIGDDEAREKLVASLVGTLQGGPKKRRAVKLTGETKVFEEGSMGEAPGGGSLSTYKELCALATDLGQPDLVYKFMDLANHQAALTSRRGAAFGFAGIAKLAGEQLAPHVSALVPKLYRYQYDPNPRVSDAMTHIWHALVSDPKKTVDSNFGGICTELLKEMGGRLWRNREASSAGLADLLQGRRWEEISSCFEEIWVMGLRAMDDIKESVRQSAAKLIRTLRGLTLRICDPAHTPKADATAATAVIIPLLLSPKGVTNDAAEVRALGVTLIAKICKTAGHEQLQAFLPDLTVVMLESLSQLEDQRLNYVEQHAERLGVSSDRLENVRVSASKSTPMGDTLDLCARHCSSETLEKMIPKLVQLIKRGVGLNTRAGTANFVVQLTMRHGADMKSHTGTLIKALLSASRSERSMAVRRAYTATAAQLARFASETRVVKLLNEAVEMFNGAEGDDKDARLLAGMIVKEMAKQGPEMLSRNASTVMPLAFTARSDEDADVAELWKEVWEEGTSSETAAIRLYITELAPIMVQGLSSQQWGRKAMAAKSITSAATAAPDVLPESAPKLAAALVSELTGRLWEGKEVLLEALGALSAACPKEMDEAKVLDALLVAVSRKRKVYHTGALVAMEKALTAFKGSDHYARVSAPLLEACERHSQAPSTKPKDGADESEDAPLLLPLTEVIGCLGAAWAAAGPGTISSSGASLSQALSSCLAHHHGWQVRTAALAAAQGFLSRLLGEQAPGSIVTAAASRGDVVMQEDQQLTVGGECVPWVDALVSGILDCSQDGKISQLRSAAMKSLAAVLKATNGGALLQPATREGIKSRLSDMLEGEKNTVVKADVATANKLLG